MSTRNRLANADNKFQGEYKRVLCVCSAGLLRSPTAAFILSQEPYNFNTRACGASEDFALVVLDDILISWADEFVVMTQGQATKVKDSQYYHNQPIHTTDFPDEYEYRNPELIKLMETYFSKVFLNV